MNAVLAALAVAAALWGVYGLGQSAGEAKCQAAQGTANAKAGQAQQVKTQATVNRAAATGAQAQEHLVITETFFEQLESEAHHAPPDPVDACVLPADRLRRWAAANAGPAGGGAASGEPDEPAPAPAAPGIGPDGRPGGQPPPGGPAIPPAGNPTVRPFELPANLPWQNHAGLPLVAP